MEGARSLVESSRGDYRTAFTRVQEALEAEPGDTQAIALKERIGAAMRAEEAREAEQRKLEATRLATKKLKDEEDVRKTALEVRRREADKAFQKIAEPEPHAALFQTMVWPLKGDLATVRQALLRMLGQKDARWRLSTDAKLNETSRVFRCPGRGFLIPPGRRCLVSITQTSPDEVYLCAKFFEFGGLETLPVPDEHVFNEVGGEFRSRLLKELGTELK